MVDRGERSMGRVTIDAKITNAGDRITADAGHMPAEQVRSTMVHAIVDTGVSMLVLPERVARRLGLSKSGEAIVRSADNRTEIRDIVEHADLELLGRSGTFTAVVEPDRTDVVIGRIALWSLDILVDAETQTLRPRDPDRIITEIE